MLVSLLYLLDCKKGKDSHITTCKCSRCQDSFAITELLTRVRNKYFA